MLLLYGWVLLILSCESARLFLTNGLYVPSPYVDPVSICTRDAQQAGFADAFYAITFAPPVASLLDLFTAEVFTGTSGSPTIADDKTLLFAALQTYHSSITTANGTVLSATERYWTGAADNSGIQPGLNCFNWRNSSGFGYSGQLNVGISANRTLCTTPQRFLCVSKILFVPAYVFLTNVSYVPDGGASQPDEICARQGLVALSNVSGAASFNYQAVFFTARRQLLWSMLSGSSALYDVNGSFVASDKSTLFGELANNGLLDSSFNLVGVNDSFWSGSTNDKGIPGANCGDFTDITSMGYVGTMYDGLSAYSQSCSTPARFLCGARVVPLLSPVPATSTSAFLFFSPTLVAPPLDTDGYCEMLGTTSSHPRLGPNRTYQAVFFTSRRASLQAMFAQAADIRDLDDNIIAMNASQLFNLRSPISLAALRTSSPISVNAVDHFWTGASTNDGLKAQSNCADFSDANSSSIGYYGSLAIGLNTNPSSCATALRLLCAANVVPIPAPPPAINSAYLFLSQAANWSIVGGGDQLCQQEALNSSYSSLHRSNLLYYSVAFAPNRTELVSMFRYADDIRDLEENVLASNASQLYQALGMSRRAMLDARGVKLDCATVFWTGSLDYTGINGSAACAQGMQNVGRLIEGLHYGVRPCASTLLRFLCAAVPNGTIATDSPTPWTLDQDLCSRTQVTDGLQVDCVDSGPSPSPAVSVSSASPSLSPAIFISASVNITQIAGNVSGGSVFSFVLAMRPEATDVIQGIVTQKCQGARITCEWLDPVADVYRDSGCSASSERVDLGSGVVGTRCTCTHLTVFALVLRSELQLAPLCQANSADYALLACYSLICVVGLAQLFRLTHMGLFGVSFVLHSVLCLVPVLRIVYLVAKPVIESLAGLVFLGLLPSALSLALFVHLLLAWTSIQIFSMTSSPFSKCRIPFIVIVSCVFVISVSITIAVAAAPRNQVAIVVDGSYVLAALYGAMCLLIAAAGFGMNRMLKSHTEGTGSFGGLGALRVKILVSTIGLSLCLFSSACLWVAAIQKRILTSQVGTVATSTAFYVFDCMGLCFLSILFAGGVKSGARKHVRKLQSQ